MTAPIAKEIKQASGFDGIDELRAAMPANPDAADPRDGGKLGYSAPGRKKAAGNSPPRKRPAAPPVAPDPFANDPRYQAACARMSAFGGKGMIVRGFDAGARVLDDPTFKLNEQENLAWDDFFYVLSKKPIFDVGKPIFLVLFFFFTLLAQLSWRVIERSESDFIMKLFSPKPPVEEIKP
jgi:hypothetical protein